MSEFYDHGLDMASELEPSEKTDGFNQYWNRYKGKTSRAAARKEYNRGWRDYTSGAWRKSEDGQVATVRVLIGLAIAGGALWWYLSKSKPTAVAGVAPVTKSPDQPYTMDQMI